MKKYLLPLSALFTLGLLGTFIVLKNLPAQTPESDELKLPPGFHAKVVADKLGNLRFLTISAQGDIYVRHNNITVLHSSKGDGTYDQIQSFGTNGGGGQGANGIAFRGDYLYYSTSTAVYRYKMTPGQLVPTGEPETVVDGLPNSGGHEAKSIPFDDQGNMYIDVGSPLNVYSDHDRSFGATGKDPTEFLKTHGGIWRFKADVLNQKLSDGYRFATGLRHCVSVTYNPLSKTVFAVQMGRDQLNTVDPKDFTAEQNAELPAEEMHELKDGVNFGWPFTYYDPIQKKRMIAPEFGGDGKKEAEPGKYDEPVVAFPAHWAPLQMLFYQGTQFPAKYQHGAFIAFHGSWNRAPLPQAGYNVTFVPVDDKGKPVGTYEVFADNFAGVPIIKSPHQAHYRPCGVAEGPDGSLFVCDSDKGRIWKITYTGN